MFSIIKLQCQQHFSDIDARAKEVSISQNPCNCTLEEILPYFQLEVINLQYSDLLKSNYQKNLRDFYSCLQSHELT